MRRIVARWQVTTDCHTLSLEAQPEPIIVQVDPHRIEQVINNLISNAIKYSPDGGNIQIQVCADQEKKLALLSVRDPGIGIPAHQQARIFGRFVRADNVREREIGGTGLGLYLSRELIERHNGRIWFESVEGHGSTFFVSLPLAQQDDSSGD
jgi:signal transduction histidine kinase